MILASRNLQSFVAFFLATESYDVCEQYLAEGGPENVELARKIFPFAKMALQLLLALRLVIFIASFKYKKATHFSFYLECLTQVTASLLPVNSALAEYYLIYQMLINYMDFWLSYFHFWSSLASSLAMQLFFYAARNMFYGDSIADLAIFGVFSIFWHSLNLLFIHLVITKVGMLYAETEVLRAGND